MSLYMYGKRNRKGTNRSGKRSDRKLRKYEGKKYLKANTIKAGSYSKISQQNLKLPWGQSIPDCTYTKLVYSTSYSVAPSGAATPNTWAFLGNGIYDPDYTSFGHQPGTYDYWNNFYNKYVVLASSIKAECLINAQTTATPGSGSVALYLCPSNDSTSPYVAYGGSDISSLQEIPRIKRVSGHYTTKNPFSIKGFIRTGTVHGLTDKQVLSDQSWSAPYNSVPPTDRRTYWWLMLHATSPSTTLPFDVTINVKITYYVKLFSRTLAGYSS